MANWQISPLPFPSIENAGEVEVVIEKEDDPQNPVIRSFPYPEEREKPK